jgi:UV DNA damage endonuclease
MSLVHELPDGEMTPRLGLVCITASDQVRFRTLTRKRLLQLDAPEQRRVLRQLYADNLTRLAGALDFCAAEGIRLYRLTSALLPFADAPVGEPIMVEFTDVLRATGERATALGIRLVLHPDQFVVLNSDSPPVVEMSLKILATHARILDLLAQPRSPWTAIELHGGKRDRADQLVKVIRDLPEPIGSRLALENDEYMYGAEEILDICRQAGVPMIFDAHHHVCYEGLTSYDDPSLAQMLAAARQTWPAPQWQIVHISNGRRSFADRRHSDLITMMPSAYRNAPWIEVEAKLKEEAIRKLRAEWLPMRLEARQQCGW